MFYVHKKFDLNQASSETMMEKATVTKSIKKVALNLFSSMKNSVFNFFLFLIWGQFQVRY